MTTSPTILESTIASFQERSDTNGLRDKKLKELEGIYPGIKTLVAALLGTYESSLSEEEKNKLQVELSRNKSGRHKALEIDFDPMIFSLNPDTAIPAPSYGFSLDVKKLIRRDEVLTWQLGVKILNNGALQCRMKNAEKDFSKFQLDTAEDVKQAMAQWLGRVFSRVHLTCAEVSIRAPSQSASTLTA